MSHHSGSRQYVQAWLDNIPALESPSHDHDVRRGLKRIKRRQSDGTSAASKRRRLPTPPNSNSMSLSPSKRSHDDTESSSIASSYQDNDRTPRSKKTKPLPAWGYKLSAAPSHRSGSSSPRKQARSNVKTASSRQYNGQEVPERLRNMWRDIGRFDKGIGIIGYAERNNVEAALNTIPEYEQDVFESFFYEQPQDDASDMTRSKFGPTPSVTAVLDIIERGMCCRNEQIDEAGWNHIVHGRILELAFEGLWRKTDDLVATIPCTSAAILTDYVDANGRKVDFCACIRPDALSAAAISSIREQDSLANISINHTDFPPLQARPIALSIETKIHGEGLNSAETQLATWHSAQWRVLDRLVGRAEPKKDLPEFLPGIIIQGHEWQFVASTKAGDQVTLWTSQHIGSTAKVTGVYQIVCVLQYLKRWIEREYWPWYQRAVLRLSLET